MDIYENATYSGLLTYCLCDYKNTKIIRTNSRRRRISDVHFIESPNNVTSYVGQTTVLECNVKNLRGKQVAWRKLPSTSPLTIGTFVFEPDPKYKIRNDNKREQWDLIIENVEKKHAGTYECQIPSNTKIAVQVNLTVLDRSPESRKHEVHIWGTQYVDVGETITLQCNASGVEYIPEEVDWFKDGNEIKPNTQPNVIIRKFPSVNERSLRSTLQIMHGRMSDAGTYICRISESDIASIKVHVLNDPRKEGPKGRDNRKRDSCFPFPGDCEDKKKGTPDSDGKSSSSKGTASGRGHLAKAQNILLWTCIFLALISHHILKNL
ncbi:zwei Ig domain protein zig-8 [Octopus bimaculoides]|nr:zwei Ig domain protein zig-8 [Octopus bimaculoides]